MNIGGLSLNGNLILAPMAGITDLPYRRIMKRFGAALVFSEMISANGLVRDSRKTLDLLCSSADERPFGIQLFGDDPETVAEAARRVACGADLIDLNFGCPVPKIVRSGGGSALLREPAKLARIVAAVRRATPLPLTVKIRSGWDERSINFLEVGQIAEAEGADAVTLHPRTRSQGFSGRADWEQIRLLKESLRVPVIGSGDVFSAGDAPALLARTGCDAVMIGRGGYGNPWLFKAIADRLAGRQTIEPSPQERLDVASCHLEYHLEVFGLRKTLLDMRKHLCWYARGLTGAAAFRTVVNRLQSVEELRAAMTAFFGASPTPDCQA